MSQSYGHSSEWAAKAKARSDGDRPSPSEGSYAFQAVPLEAVQRILNDLTTIEREALQRFYVLSQRPEVICRDLKMSLTQFREIKSGVKKQLATCSNR